MEAHEGIGKAAAPEGQPLLELDHGIPVAPDKDSLASSRESFKTQPLFPAVLTYPLCQETVVR